SVGAAAGDSGPPTGLLEGRIVEGETLAPIEGATIVITDAKRGPVVVSGVTDAHGWFHYRIPPGTYDVLAIFADARWVHKGVTVEINKTVQVPGTLSLEAETVTVREKAPKKEHRAPEAVRSTVKPILPYSDEAIDQNIW